MNEAKERAPLQVKSGRFVYTISFNAMILMRFCSLLILNTTYNLPRHLQTHPTYLAFAKVNCRGALSHKTKTPHVRKISHTQFAYNPHGLIQTKQQIRLAIKILIPQRFRRWSLSSFLVKHRNWSYQKYFETNWISIRSFNLNGQKVFQRQQFA